MLASRRCGWWRAGAGLFEAKRAAGCGRARCAGSTHACMASSAGGSGQQQGLRSPHPAPWLQRIAEAVKAHGGIQRFIHASALGAAPDAPSKRLRTKAAGEEVVREELGDIATVFKLAHM